MKINDNYEKAQRHENLLYKINMIIPFQKLSKEVIKIIA